MNLVDSPFICKDKEGKIEVTSSLHNIFVFVLIVAIGLIYELMVEWKKQERGL